MVLIGKKRETVDILRQTAVLTTDPFANYIALGDQYLNPGDEVPWDTNITYGNKVLAVGGTGYSWQFVFDGNIGGYLDANPTADSVLICCGYSDIFFAAATIGALQTYVQNAIAEVNARDKDIMFASLVPYRGAPGFDVNKETTVLEYNAYVEATAASTERVFFVDFFSTLEDPAKPLHMNPLYNAGSDIDFNAAGAAALGASIDAAMADAAIGDEYGDAQAVNWVSQFTRRASVTGVRGKEFLAQDRTKSEVTHRVFVRNDSQTATITPTDRIQWRGTTLEIVSVIPSAKKRRELEIMCREIT